MGIVSLPAAAKVTEYRLFIDIIDDTPISPITLKAPYAPGLTEMWKGDLVLAAMTRRNAQAVAAFLESLDGKITPFLLPMPSGVIGQLGAWSASLLDNPRLGSNTLNMAVSPEGAILKAGTLITIGDINGDPFQMFEVLQDVTTSATTVVTIAPRVRRSFSGHYDVVDVGDVQARFCLAEDFPNVDILLSHGVASVSVMEAL